MAQECWQSVTRVSENTENRHFKGISQPPLRGHWGLGIRHSGVTFLLWSETLSARTPPTCGTQSPGAGTRAISRPLCICPTTSRSRNLSSRRVSWERKGSLSETLCCEEREHNFPATGRTAAHVCSHSFGAHLLMRLKYHEL